MDRILRLVYIILTVALIAACEAATSVPINTATVTSEPNSIPLSPTPAIDPDIITPANAKELIQIKQLGMGFLANDPVYSPDGQWMFISTTVGVFVIDTASYQSSRLLAYTSGRLEVAISPDGRLLAVGNKILSTDDGQELPAPNLPLRAESAKFSPDGRLLALIYGGDQLAIWHLADNKLLYTLRAKSVDFSVDGRRMIVIVDSDTTPRVHLYDTQAGNLLQEWPGERAAFLSENHLAVEANGAVRVYDLSTGKAPYAFNGKHAAFSPDGQLVGLLFYNQAEIHRVADGALLHTLEGNFEGVDDLTLRFAPDGQTLVGSAYWGYCCAGYNLRLSLWRVTDGALIKETNSSRSFVFAPDGHSLAVTGDGLQIWNTSDGSLRVKVDGFTNIIGDVAFLPDGGELVASINGEDRFLVYQPDSDQVSWLEISELQALYGSPINQVGEFGRSLWNKPKELISKIVESGGYARSMLLSPDNKFVAVGSSYSGILRLWNVADQNLILEGTACPDKDIVDLAFSPDGGQLALACADPVFEDYGAPFIQVWQVAPQGKRLMELSGHGYTIVTYSPDGRYIAGAGNHLQVWSATDGKPIFGVDRNLFQSLDVQSIAFSPDGQILAFGLKDGSVELWSVTDGKQLSVLRTTDYYPLYNQYGYNPVHGLAFSPYGKLLAMGLDDGSVRLWGVK